MSASTSNKDVTTDQQQLDEAENYHLGPRKSSSIKKRETFDSAYLRRPNIVDRSSSTTNENNDTNNRLTLQPDAARLRRRHSDVPEGKREEKRLVVVDSTYINVSTVGDGYAKINKTQQRNSFKNRENESRENRISDSERLLGDSNQSQLTKRNSLKNNRETENRDSRASEPEWTAVALTTKYRADDESLRPFDSSIDATLPSNISDSYSKDCSTSDNRLSSPKVFNEPCSKESDNYTSVKDDVQKADSYNTSSFCREQQFYPTLPQREHLFSDSHVSSSRERLQESHTLKERRTSDSCNNASLKDTVVVTTGSRRHHLDSVGTTNSSSLGASNLSLLTSSNSSLPSNFSAEDELHLTDDALSNLSLSTEQLPTKSNENYLSSVVATPNVTDGHAHSTHSGKRKKHKSKDKQHKEHKEKKKHKHKKHHKHSNSKDNSEDPLESLAKNTKSFESPAPTKKSQLSGTPAGMGHSSDDSKSIDSFDSLEEFQQPSSTAAPSQPVRTVPRNQYYSSSDSNRTTPEKSLDSELTTTPRTQSPQCLEGDAKLVSKPYFFVLIYYIKEYCQIFPFSRSFISNLTLFRIFHYHGNN